MSLRTFSLLASALVLGACAEASGEVEGPSVDCAIGPGSELTSTCTFERDEGNAFLVHHPDGGFRRFAVEQGEDGALIVTADGAERIAFQSYSADGSQIEFGLTDEAYRMDAALIVSSVQGEANSAGTDE